MTTYVPRNAITKPGPDGTLQHEPAYVAGWEARKRGQPTPRLGALWREGDESRRGDRLCIQGWHDADRAIKGGGR